MPISINILLEISQTVQQTLSIVYTSELDWRFCCRMKLDCNTFVSLSWSSYLCKWYNSWNIFSNILAYSSSHRYCWTQVEYKQCLLHFFSPPGLVRTSSLTRLTASLTMSGTPAGSSSLSPATMPDGFFAIGEFLTNSWTKLFTSSGSSSCGQWPAKKKPA